jgi:FkbM family methyltransferase
MNLQIASRRFWSTLKLVRLLGLKQTLRFAVARYFGSSNIVTLRLKGIPHPLHARARGRDINCLWQVFGNLDCQIELSPPPHVIIDGGAHVGFASVYLANRFPNAVIFAVEPESANLELAKRNLQYYPNVRLLQSGIWSKDSQLVIENPEAESWAFRVREVPQATAGSFTGRSIDSLMQEARLSQVDLVKLDIEGAETEVFNAPRLDWLEQNRALIIEIHGKKAAATVGGAMQRQGYRFYQRGDKFIFRRPSSIPSGQPC